MRPDRTTVVVPTYNEAANLAHVAAAILLHGYRLVVVDDGSPDGTGDIAEGVAAQIDRVEVIHRPAKAGLGSAYAAGFTRALADGAEVVVAMDADLSHNPADLPRLVSAVAAGADLAIGSRYVPGGSTPDWPAARRLISRAGNGYARTMLGMGVRDATAGFRAFRAEALARLPFRRAEASGYAFQVEMVWHAVDQDMRVVEIPIVFRDRHQGTSKMGLGIVAEAMWLVTRWGVGRLLSPRR